MEEKIKNINNCEKGKKVTDIKSYIEKIEELTKNTQENTTIVYRGENKKYEKTYCQPNLFRNSNFKKNKFFERNILNEMRSNRISDTVSYLETAVDAQHGGFPSRLLDVTYNSLVALYFAVTPSVNKNEDVNDGEDGYVYIYEIPDLFCPSANNINELFDSIINRKDKWLFENDIFQRNHKLIDHIKLNNRIIAQQGAFILFQGDEIYPIQEHYYKEIVIDGEKKAKIRKELKLFFGIHTGSIYPESNNLVDYIQNKSMKINNNEFSIDSELELFISNFIRDIENLKQNLIEKWKKNYINKNEDSVIDIMIEETMDIEKNIYYYKLELEELINNSLDNIYYIKDKYNNIVNDFITDISVYLYSFGIEIDKKNLIININL